jgi:glyoxylase-like metal-dependent hydrolase (beta-lactamase superfamily II)
MIVRIGPAEVRTVMDGRFHLDGGAMFGIVPKAVWSTSDPPDADNRIALALRCLLVQVDDRVIVVDTGIGTKWSEPDVARFRIEHDDHELVRSLASLGVAQEDVTDVILTHLHFDHSGGTTRFDQRGRIELTFPKAKHHLQRRNLMHALRPTARDLGSYLAENFDLLSKSAQLVLIDGPEEIAAGVDVILCEGHTVGQQLVRVRDPTPNGKWLLYATDIVPTSSHLSSAFVMGYDLMPDVTAREKAHIIERAEREGGLVVFEHDPDIAACTIQLDVKKRPIVKDAVQSL